jgi:hypothetical protein
VKSPSFEAEERRILLMLLVISVAPFIPFTGDGSLSEWMSQYTMDTIGGRRTGYVMTYLVCWILFAVPYLIIEAVWVGRKTPKQEPKPAGIPEPSPSPTLEDLRTTFRAGMVKDEFFDACDSLLERFGGLRMGTPSASETLISIHVAEGDSVYFFLSDEGLVYAEYRGGIFLGEPV